jgi:hypothetical protein
MLANGPRTLSSSSCRVWCSRSIFPVVVGERGLVSRWVMPFSRQIRPNITSAGRGFPNRPVNCLPLSVRTSKGIPYSVIAAVNARQTALAVARMTTAAMTQNREWSSIPVTTLHSRPSARNRLAVTSICHSSIAAERFQRR